jgi:hypothetical protein
MEAASRMTTTEPPRAEERQQLDWARYLVRVRRWLEPHRPMLVDVLCVFAISRLIFYLTTALAIGALPEYSGGQYDIWHTSAHALIDASWRWDAGWYHSIILHGYTTGNGSQQSVVFFPLYPALVKLALVPFSTRWIWAAGVLVNHLAFLAALVPIWLYAHSFGGRPVAQRTLFYLAIFPTSLFFTAAYSESVFLLVTAIGLLALQRGRFTVAGAAGFCATLTRPTGMLLAVPYVVEVWRRRWAPVPEMARRAAILLLIPAGLALFMAFLWRQFGDPLHCLSAQQAWHHERRFPLGTLLDALSQIRTGTRGTIYYAMNVINTLAGLFALAMGTVIARRSHAAGAYVLAGALLPLAFPIEAAPTVSLARYVMVLFPMLIPLARRTSSQLTQLLVVALFLPANVLLTALFVRWYWVI